VSDIPAQSRILIHDYAGHAFTVQLARWLAQSGFETHYWYSSDIESPRGNLQLQPGDAATLSIRGISVGAGKVEKYIPIARLKAERAYGRTIAEQTRALAPTIVLSNAPPHIQAKLRKAAQRSGVFVWWMQDIYSLALRHLLAKKSPLAAAIGGSLSQAYEHAELRKSDAVVCISEAFRDYCAAHGVRPARCTVIGNWAALDEIPVLPKDNDWSRGQGLHDKFVFLFSGTLGLKHNPEVFIRLCESLRDTPQAVCVVVSEGTGREWLEDQKKALGLSNLLLYGYQPHTQFPQVLASGDVLMAILEPFASELSVPSKVLAYFCAGRPLLVSIPASNHSARLVTETESGVLVPPGDHDAFLRAAHALMVDDAGRHRHATAALAFAQRAFHMDRIGAEFLAAFAGARHAAEK
jgi:colanic acid biosynthesis glycosyl transferase WcaI